MLVLINLTVYILAQSVTLVSDICFCSHSFINLLTVSLDVEVTVLFEHIMTTLIFNIMPKTTEQHLQLFPILHYINLLLICDAVQSAMTSQLCNTNPYCIVVSHACIHAPMVRSQPKPKIVRCVTGTPAARNMASQPSICRLHYPFIRITEVNTHCATSDVNPFKKRCNLQITKAIGVSETQ